MKKVIFIEEKVSKESIQWGSHTDPRGILEDGKEYEVYKDEVHSYHTRRFLVGIKGYFNTVWFEPADSVTPEEKAELLKKGE
ncbi:hypothetical protein KAR91_25965 [Candidatus Pacearchaeota archaeon]|nr:hypothetical protein [Candidatus Pacearchaeota archaeon]